MAQILPPTPANIIFAGNTLRAGELVGMPTETVYGLAACVFDEGALAKVFAVKERPTFDPLIVHVSPKMVEGAPLERLGELGLVDLARLDAKSRVDADRLLRAFWPGPLTLVLPRGADVPDLATSGLDTVGLRMPRHPVAQALIDAAGSPLAAPSANRFGRISPTTANDVETELGERIDVILDGGPCAIGLESTVLRLAGDGAPLLLRPGGLTRSELAAVLGREPVVAAGATTATLGMAAPGMLDSHYAPRTPLWILTGPIALQTDQQLRAARADAGAAAGGSAGLLLMSGDAQGAARRFKEVTGLKSSSVSLSVDGNPVEIARHLFQGLRQLDEAGHALLFAEPSPTEEGLGHAIADRLRRAARRS